MELKINMSTLKIKDINERLLNFILQVDVQKKYKKFYENFMMDDDYKLMKVYIEIINKLIPEDLMFGVYPNTTILTFFPKKLTKMTKVVDMTSDDMVNTTKVVKKEKIQLFSGRPKRDLIINNDDLFNLKIILETSKTFEDFIKQL
jgi:hypothetical protein